MHRSDTQSQDIISLGRLRLANQNAEAGLTRACSSAQDLESSHSPADQSLCICIVAAGIRASGRAEGLARYCRHWLEGDCTVDLIRLETTDRAPPSQHHEIAARSRIGDQLVASDLTIVVAEGGLPWDSLIAGDDPLLAVIRPNATLHIALEHSEPDIAELITAARSWRVGATVAENTEPNQAAVTMRMLDGVPETILCSLIRMGLVCVDLADYLDTLGDGPLLLNAGFSTAAGPNRAQHAFTAALDDLERRSNATDRPVAGLAAVGVPLDGRIEEMEEACLRFKRWFSPDDVLWPMVAAPAVPGRLLEVGLVVGHRP